MKDDSQFLLLLEHLGLKKTETRVYLTTLEQGKTTILAIAKATGIKRETIYGIATRLVDKGFLKITISEKKRYFIAEDPRIITARFKGYSEALFAKLPQLLAMQNSNENKPKVTYYEGEDEVWQIYEDTLRVGKPFVSFTSAIDMNRLLDPKNIENYIRRRVEKKIPTKTVAIDSELSRNWLKTAKNEFREIRLIPKEQYNFSATIEIYGNKVGIISYREDVFGLMIESEQISQMFKVAFELMWESAKLQEYS